MSVKREIVIKDACVLFDLMDLEILPLFYELDIVVFTTPQVIAEITDEEQLREVNQYIDSGKLLIDVFGSVETIIVIIDANPGLSFTDGSIIELASRKHATVLSSDKSLRKESERRGLTVRGVLWVIEKLERNQLLTVAKALELLGKYHKVNVRAPLTEIDKLIKKLSER